MIGHPAVYASEFEGVIRRERENIRYRDRAGRVNMIASDFRQPPRRNFPALVRFGAYIPLLGLGVPLVKALELTGAWPRVLFRVPRRQAQAGSQPLMLDPQTVVKR